VVEALREGFRYDIWANRLWLECLKGKGEPEPHMSIFQHILAAQAVWLERCEGHSPTQMPEPAASLEELERLNQSWLALLDGDPDARIHYRRVNGDAHSLTLSQIARHVINHGTYHRGELRGLLRATGDEDFPETDLARHAVEMQASVL